MRKKRISKRIVCGILASVFLTGGIAFAGSGFDPVQAETIQELQKQQEQLQKEKEDLKKQQEELKKKQQEQQKKQDSLSEEEKSQNSKKSELNTEKDKTQAEVDELARQLDALLKELEVINAKADALVVDIGKANAELEEQQQKSELQYNDMKLRIQYMYENQTASIEESIVASEDIGDVLNAADYYQKIYDYDRNMLDEIAATIKRIEELTESLNIQLAEVEETQKQMNDKQNEINNIVSEKQDYISLMDSRIAEAAKAASEAAQARKNAEAEEARLAEQEKKIAAQAEAKAVEQARLREEEEAKRKAEEEARRRAAEEARRKAAQEEAERQAAAARAAAAAQAAEAAQRQANVASSSSSSASYYEEPVSTPAASSSSSSSGSSSSYTSATTQSGSGLGYIIAANARANNGWYPATYGMCAQWVAGIYAQSGAGRPYGNAIDYWNKWSYSGSTSMSNIPVGAAVISSGAGVLAQTYGHIGIYLGDGMVASNIGGVKIETIQNFDRWSTATCQGHRGYIGWVWPNGVAQN